VTTDEPGDDELVVRIYSATSSDDPSLPDGVVELRLEDGTVLDYTAFGESS
jgi:hypothetical protein